MTDPRLKLAILIDGDNVSCAAVESLFARIEDLGNAVVRRVYCGSQAESKRWGDLSCRLALSLGRRHLHLTGRNATDIEMVIEAMDLLAEEVVQGFCLVSSDADFTALAIRLRQSGKTVYGYGQSKAPESFRNACDQFFVIAPDVLAFSSGNVVPFTNPALDRAVAGMRDAITRHAAGDGWAHLSLIGGELKKLIPGFKPSDYGASTLKQLAVKAGCFDLKTTERGLILLR